MDNDRIWSSEQINVPQELPQIMKEYTKAVIRANPPDVLSFSIDYFKDKAKEVAVSQPSDDTTTPSQAA